MTFRKICIVGPGAVGGMIAVMLARAGFEVSALARPRKADAINAHGLTVHTGGETLRAKIRAAATPDLLGPHDMVVVALKGDALADVAGDLAPLLAPGAPLVFAMNGVPWWFFENFGGPFAGTRLNSLDPDGTLARLIPTERVVWGVVNFSVSALSDCVIDHTNNNQLAFGRPDNSTAGLDAICEVFAKGKYACEVSSDIRRLIFAKLAINTTMSPVSTLTGATLTQLFDDPLLHEGMHAIQAELRNVGIKLGLDPGPSPIDKLKNAKVRTSMLQDFERGRPLELSTIIEAAVEIGNAAGVAIPQTRMLLGLIRTRARTAGLLQ